MTYPLNKQEFVSAWLAAIGDPDNDDKELAEAIASMANRAYEAGVKAGLRKAGAAV